MNSHPADVQLINVNNGTADTGQRGDDDDGRRLEEQSRSKSSAWESSFQVWLLSAWVLLPLR